MLSHMHVAVTLRKYGDMDYLHWLLEIIHLINSAFNLFPEDEDSFYS